MSYVCPWCGQSQQIHTQKHHIYEHYFWFERAREGTVGKSFVCFSINVYACAKMHAVQVILLTCDLPNGAEYVEFFWVQSLNIVIDISVNDNGRSERHKQKHKDHRICILYYIYVQV